MNEQTHTFFIELTHICTFFKILDPPLKTLNWNSQAYLLGWAYSPPFIITCVTWSWLPPLSFISHLHCPVFYCLPWGSWWLPLSQAGRPAYCHGTSGNGDNIRGLIIPPLQLRSQWPEVSVVCNSEWESCLSDYYTTLHDTTRHTRGLLPSGSRHVYYKGMCVMFVGLNTRFHWLLFLLIILYQWTKLRFLWIGKYLLTLLSSVSATCLKLYSLVKFYQSSKLS